MNTRQVVQLGYKLSYLFTKKEWGDFSEWLDDEIAKNGNFEFDHHAPQPPEPKKGKWQTVTNSMQWVSKYYDPVMSLCKQLRRGKRGDPDKQGWIKAGYQREMAGQVYKWMKEGEMQLNVEWLKEFSTIITGWVRWSIQGHSEPYYFASGFKTIQMPRHVLGRVALLQEIEADPLSAEHFPGTAALLEELGADDDFVEQFKAQLTGGITATLQETRYWFQEWVRFPELFWIATDLEVGPYFVQRVLHCMEMELADTWSNDQMEQLQHLHEQTAAKCTEEQQQLIDDLFTEEWHAQWLDGCSDLNLRKYKKEGIATYDPIDGLQQFWAKHRLGAVEHADQWLKIASGGLNGERMIFGTSFSAWLLSCHITTI